MDLPNPILVKVTERVIARSQKTRAAYLQRIEDAQGRPITEPRTVVATRSYQYNVETVNTDDQEKNYLNQVIVDDVAQQIVRQISSNRLPPAQQ